MMAATVLVVEDDAEILQLVQLYLESAGYETLIAASGEEALRQFRHGAVDLIILDILLPGVSGVEVCREIRLHSQVPIIFISSKSDVRDVIAGLELGADDYVTKPFDPEVLIARVKANLRRTGVFVADGGDSLWKSGRLTVDLHSYDVYVDGQPVRLFTKERQLLLFFIKNPRRVFHVDQLFAQIWGDGHDGDPRTVMVHIHNLRKKIELDPGKPSYIRTVRGFGYKFVADDATHPTLF